jgi:hypothetical protein
MEIGTFQPSLGFKDFRRAARLHSPTNGQFGGEKRAGLRPPPRPQLQGFSSSRLRRRSAPSGGIASTWAGNPFLPPAFGGERHPPALRRLPSAMPGKANCCCPARVQHSVLCPGDGGQPHQGVSQHVVHHEGGTRVLGWSHSRFRGEDGSEDLPVRFGAADARWCGVGGQVEVLLLGSSSEARPGSVEGGINVEGAAAPPADARACRNSLSIACACFFAAAEAQTCHCRVIKLRLFSSCLEYQGLLVGSRIVYPSESYLSRKVMSEVSVSRRRRSPSARSTFAAYVYSCSSAGLCYRYSREGTKNRFGREVFER